MTDLSVASRPNTSLPTDRHNQAASDYAAGNLSPAKHDLIACAIDLNPRLANAVAVKTSAAASLMMETRPIPLSPLLIGATLGRLPNGRSTVNQSDPIETASGLEPKTLRNLLGGVGLRDIKWKSLIPGVAVHDIMGGRKTRRGERMYLLRAKGGMKFPEHSHHGEEWTLILKGSYSTAGNRYCRGDLHISDSETAHAPTIGRDEDCICLVVTQGRLNMKSWLPKILQHVVGI